jgi:hypothetical protein
MENPVTGDSRLVIGDSNILILLFFSVTLSGTGFSLWVWWLQGLKLTG